MRPTETIWQVLDTDSRPVEASTAAICGAIALGAIVTGASWASHPLIAWAWLACTVFHFWTATTEHCRLRQMMACISVIVFALLGWRLLMMHGVDDRPGIPALFVAAGVQCWVYLALESRCVDHRRQDQTCN